MKRKKKVILQDTRIIFQWMCPYCGMPNDDAAQSCVHCNVVRPEKPRLLNVSAEEPTIKRREAWDEKHFQTGCRRIVNDVVCGFVGLLMAIGIIGSIVTEIGKKVERKSRDFTSYWQSDIEIEAWGMHRFTSTVLPEGAELHATITSEGHPTEFDYEYETWATVRTVTVTGDIGTVPYYDDDGVVLAENEREGERSTSFYVTFMTKDGEVTEEITEQQFRRIAEEDCVRYTREEDVYGYITYTVCN